MVEAALLEDVGDVAAGEDDDGVAVFADSLVGLAVQVVTRTPNCRWRSREMSLLVSRTPTPWSGA